MNFTAEALLAAALAPTRLREIKGRVLTPRGVRAAERAYEADLRKWHRAFLRITLEELNPVFSTAFDPLRADAFFDREALRRALERTRARLEGIAQVARDAITKARRRINKDNLSEMKRVLPVLIPDSSPELENILNSWEVANQESLNGFAERTLARVRKAFDREDETTAQVLARVRDIMSSSRNELDLVADGQILQANAQLTEQRSKQAGFNQYVWVTKRDDRVRKGHARLHNTVHSWDDPPNTGAREGRNHPGRPHNCRCVAKPYLPSR